MAPPQKRSGKRGSKPTTLVKKAIVTFVDPQPKDRYNLVYYAKYSRNESVLQKVDESYLKYYHQKFPNRLLSYPTWGKSPGSRSHCHAHRFKQVSSLNEIASDIYEFLSIEKRDDKKIGTIIITGHGTPTEFALPIITGGDRIALSELVIGLQYADSIGKKAPSRWPGDHASWKKFKNQFMRLQVATDLLKRSAAGRIDDQTLVRIWCCNLGTPPKSGKDPLKAFGRIFFGNRNFMVEAPRNISGNTYQYYSNFPSFIHHDRELGKIYRDQEKRKVWHPDAIADIESDTAYHKIKGQALMEARSRFIWDVSQSPPPPGSRRRAKWIPIFFVKDNRGKLVYPGKWAKFKKNWRRVVVA